MATVLKSAFPPMPTTSQVQLEVVGRSEPKTEPEDPIFSREEIAEFRKQDVEAGSFVAKVLCAMFAWSVFILSVVVWWTFRTV